MAVANITKDDVKEFIKSMKVIDLANFVKELETEFGVSAQAPVAVVGVAAGGAQAPVEEKTEFNVILAAAGANKISVIKEVRTITGLGLKEAKDLVEGAPKPLKDGVSKQVAEEIKKTLEAAGAKVEIK